MIFGEVKKQNKTVLQCTTTVLLTTNPDISITSRAGLYLEVNAHWSNAVFAHFEENSLAHMLDCNLSSRYIEYVAVDGP